MSEDTQRMDEQPEVEGHVLRQAPERAAFGTADAAAAERRPAGIRPDDGPEPEVEGHLRLMGAEGIRPLGEPDVEEPEVEGHRLMSDAERIAYEAERSRG
jgi:hypothetical protein